MKIILAKHSGFCYGVERAVRMAKGCAEGKGHVATLGPIIHNPQVVEDLRREGIAVADDLADIEAGTVIIRSHGVGPGVFQEATRRNLTIVDATCPHVKKAQTAAQALKEAGYQVVVVGEKRHPEVQSIVAWTDNTALVVETPEEAEAVTREARMGIVAQTTFPPQRFEEIVAILKTKSPEVKVDRTICRATELRQQAAVDLAAEVGVIVVVGGKNSANTARLAELCQQAGVKVYSVETADEVSADWFAETKVAGVTAGASTPDWIIEEVVKKMQEIDQDLNQDVVRLEQGSIVKGKVVSVRPDEVFVDIGYKAEGIVPLAELAYPIPQSAADVVSEGDMIDVLVLDADSSEGAIKLSKIQADHIVAWDKLEQALQDKQLLEGKVLEAVKGGLSVAVLGVRGFIPASQVDLKFVEDLSSYVGQSFSLQLIEVDREKRRVVLSRRVLLEEERRRLEEETYAKVTPGAMIKGTVRRLADFGVFVDIGGVDGLIHISDLAWHRVKSPDEIVSVGDEVEVIVLKVDPAARRISLSLKAVQRDPWFDAVDELAEGKIVPGKVTKTTKFGAFVEIAKGVEGLVHISELDDRRVNNAEEVVTAGQEVPVKILGIDRKAKRISLSVVQARQDVDRAEYSSFLDKETAGMGFTIGDKLGHLFKKRED
ncbi:MAG: bifunctional 4-hydroxy-3-methylbut-2-enyl diphosphate reductase/30S ribosomal protein S1 [Negativicutes bacterium]|nr:bifunctional 4-hydroxy-3-methylbut-2-enyl diphosphate reductase/30S ribosomal protein S1 [Negativicutes bacterium]